ncbi:unnamed protein product [Microthlaspi erraticum]|uniref:Uncharacterized protein n=1 Tax=Microthlaspi erraticum TaxID=1685480 RepID=A0A6D2IJW5_9BRAS|nr:unnamed protein product [Microthlaspi erraticum]
MNTKNNVVEDVSTFFVFEASADSETHEERRQHGNANDDKGYEVYGNDAESTSQKTIGGTGYVELETESFSLAECVRLQSHVPEGCELLIDSMANTS